MTTPEDTQPNPNVQKAETDAAIVGAFIKKHWVWCGPLIFLVIGAIIGKVV